MKSLMILFAIGLLCLTMQLVTADNSRKLQFTASNDAKCNLVEARREKGGSMYIINCGCKETDKQGYSCLYNSKGDSLFECDNLHGNIMEKIAHELEGRWFIRYYTYTWTIGIKVYSSHHIIIIILIHKSVLIHFCASIRYHIVSSPVIRSNAWL